MKSFIFHMSVLICGITLSLCAVISHVHALESYVSVDVEPAYPAAGEMITVSVSSFAFDMNRAYVTWYENGAYRSEGTGLNTFSTEAGNTGITMTISATIVSPDNETITKTVRFTPGGGVDLLWEAIDAYTPPFYRGKALPASQAHVKVIAVPHLTTGNGTKLDADTITYTWQRNGFYRDTKSQSGYGRSTLLLMKDILLPNETVSVTATSPGGSLSARESINLPEVDPEIIFYEEHPTLGVRFNEALVNGILLRERETVIRAEPYFFSTDNHNRSSLSYDWSVGGRHVSSHWNNPGDLAIDVPEGTTGNTALSLSVTYTDRMLQSLKETLSITFGDTENTFFQ
ncbi:MAG: hypothetical protein H8D63_00880 [Parcubacteria group bacterium]|nr:hypothetical protein [Parcubacteria group bacterium]